MTAIRKKAPNAIKIALQLFNECLLPYLTSNNEKAAKKLIELGLAHAWLRSELWCQLIKQLSECPDETQYDRGWRLVRVCLKYVPPRGTEIECVVEQFLSKYEAKDYIALLHTSLFSEAAPPVFDGSTAELWQCKPPEVPASEKVAMQNRRLEKKMRGYCSRMC